MSSRYQHELSPGGLDVIRLQSDDIDLAIVPQAGGKIRDFIDCRNGRNWLWKNPHIPISFAEHGKDFEMDQDSGAWDEVLLSIKPGRMDRASEHIAAIPDHAFDIARNMPLRVDDAQTRAHSAEETEQRWPNLSLRDGESFDLSQSFASNASRRSFASEIFVRSPHNGSAGVSLKDGSSLR